MNDFHFMRHTLASVAAMSLLAACPSDDGEGPEDAQEASTSEPATEPAESTGGEQPGTSDGEATDATEGETADSSEGGDTTGAFGDYEPNCDGTFEVTAPDPNYPWTPLSIQLASEELSPGVFVAYDERALELTPEQAPLATSAGFIIGEDGVLLVESMINQQLACQLYDLVREQTELPILYIVNTSHHGDHSYGNHFFGPDTQIVQHEETADFISQHFEADRAWMIQNFGANQGMEEVQPREADVRVGEEGWSVDLGGVTVEARYFGFGQTHGDLWVWLPDQHVLWAGNAQVSGNPGLPWLLDGNGEASMATTQNVADFLPPDAIVIPGHDAPQTPDVFDFTIDYLQTLLFEVGEAVDAGLSLEETLATVTMDDFRGYVLFDWVHPVINVTNTYGDLTE
ncbi:MAG: MBL fold metallo-hydrolase [Myxococcota bacterium]